MKAEQGPGVGLIVVTLPSLGQVLFGPFGKHVTFQMRLVLPDSGLKILYRAISFFRGRGHGRHGNVQQFARLIGRPDNILGHRIKALLHVLARVRGGVGEDLEQDCAEQINVTVNANQFHWPDGHFRSHVRRSATHSGTLAAGRRHGQSPVHQQHFAEAAEHNILRLQVAVNYVLVVGKGDRVGGAHENAEVLMQRLFRDHLAPGSSLHPLHRVKQSVLFADPQVINRNDVRMLQVSCDHGLGQERLPGVPVGSSIRLEHLDGNGPIQGSLTSRIDYAHPSFTQQVDQLIVGPTRLVLPCVFPNGGRCAANRPRLNDQI